MAGTGGRLARGPRTFAVGGTPFACLAESARCPVILARGEHDRMVSLDELRMYRGDALDLPGLGHNAHVEDPSRCSAIRAAAISLTDT